MTQSLNENLWNQATEFKDQVVDLRLNNERPIWGQNHPLIIQDQFKMLTKINPFIQLLSAEQYQSYLSTMSAFETSENELIKLNSFQVPKDINHIEEHGLLGASGVSLFWHKDLVEENNVESIAAPLFDGKTYLLYSKNSTLSFTHSPLYSAIEDYLESVVGHETQGKNTVDFAIIDKFLISHPNITRKFRYLLFDQPLSVDKFAENGLKITSNAQALSLPIPCTNEELLDTLNKISKSI